VTDPQTEMNEQWQLSGTAPELYQRHLVPAMTAIWAADLVDRAAVRPGEQMLDLACGTGTVARVAAERAGSTGQITALDINPGMLAVARSLPPVKGAPIEWLEGSALALPFPDATYDLVLCQLGLQFFSDRSGALREIGRVLVARGRVGLSVFGPIEHNPATHALANALDRHLGPGKSVIKRSALARRHPDIALLGEPRRLQRCDDRDGDEANQIPLGERLRANPIGSHATGDPYRRAPPCSQAKRDASSRGRRRCCAAAMRRRRRIGLPSRSPRRCRQQIETGSLAVHAASPQTIRSKYECAQDPSQVRDRTRRGVATRFADDKLGIGTRRSSTPQEPRGSARALREALVPLTGSARERSERLVANAIARETPGPSPKRSSARTTIGRLKEPRSPSRAR
jgi:SAM-dependent methyltransferase